TGKVINGVTLEKISEKELKKIVEEVSIFARVNPEHKLKIVKALQMNGHVVAMTGDGVNDAPAIKKADIGIAMGITGTDVAKEASVMILTDDNFASIVNAVEEGRGIYDNIKKFVEYMLSTNIGELFTIFFGVILRMPLPIIAIQILWLNLLTDGLPAVALSVDPHDKDIMERKPRKKKESILGKTTIRRMITVSAIMAVGTLILFKYYLPDEIHARTVAFSTLVLLQLFNVISCKSEKVPFFRILFNNWYLLGAVALSVLLQLMIIYTPLSFVFKTMPLPASEWIIIVAVASLSLIYREVDKAITNKVSKE
ncbi:HAD-IC family P-type ATPase, partial [Candidatus Woesearchaeota archaeon]|nr:HAD-IC family P-type ATPase [Candidatus Woesearchaeota archaeon]